MQHFPKYPQNIFAYLGSPSLRECPLNFGEFSEFYKIYLLCKVIFNDFWKTENKKILMRDF